MSQQHPHDPTTPRFQVRPSNRAGGYFWEAFDTTQTERLVMAPTLIREQADAEAARLNKLHTAKPKHTGRNVFLGIGAGIVALIVAASLAPSEPGEPAADKLPNVVTTTSAPATTAPPAPVAEPTVEAPKPTTAPKPKATQPSLTKSQEQAIGSAESYLDYTAFSRKGLIRQLSSDAGEGFSVADATYAVDHIKVDWNEQAAKKAEQYLEMTNFSRQGLIHQLESSAGEGFTHKQAVYGVTQAGL